MDTKVLPKEDKKPSQGKIAEAPEESPIPQAELDNEGYDYFDNGFYVVGQLRKAINKPPTRSGSMPRTSIQLELERVSKSGEKEFDLLNINVSLDRYSYWAGAVEKWVKVRIEFVSVEGKTYYREV